MRILIEETILRTYSRKAISFYERQFTVIKNGGVVPIMADCDFLAFEIHHKWKHCLKVGKYMIL